MPKIINLAGVFFGSGFEKKGGRFPSLEDAAFVPGPVSIGWDYSGKMCDPSRAPGPVLDGHGLIASPGFVDSHTHSIFAGDRSFEYALRWRGASYAEISAAGGGILLTQKATSEASDLKLCQDLSDRLCTFIKNGTTTVEIKSGYGRTHDEELRLLRLVKKVCHQDLSTLPRVLKTFLGLHALPQGTEEKTFVDSMISLLSAVKKENLADFVDAFPENGFFSLESAKRFVIEAQKIGLPCKVHSDEITDMQASSTFSELGAQSVDHLQCISKTGIEGLKKNGTVATLLPATSFYLKIPYANARNLIDSGCSVALATDFNPGTAPNPLMQFSALLALSEYKMSAAEVLCATTYNGAQALGLQQEVGTLDLGKCADILLWNLSSPNDRAEALLEEIFIQQKIPVKTIVRGKWAS